LDGLENTVGEELLKPHLNYEPILRQAINENLIEGLAHITGGGITENLDRILPSGCQAEVQLGSWPVLPLCQAISELGCIERDEMLRATNMGIGMVIVVRPSKLEALHQALSTPCYQIGRIIPGEPRVTYRI
jgi:phosphoribosylformylglycinamidine cyclo-ligase